MNKKKPENDIFTPMELQQELANMPDRMLPQNLPEEEFRELLKHAWAWSNHDDHDAISPLIDYVHDIAIMRSTHLPDDADPGEMMHRLFGNSRDPEAWALTLSWIAQALTGEWGNREGYVAPPNYTIENFDFQSPLEWGVPVVPGAIPRKAEPNNRLVELLASAMDAVFDPEHRHELSCEICEKNRLYSELPFIAEAIQQADEELENNFSEQATLQDKLIGAIASLALSNYYREGSEEVRAHCYHIAHGAVNSAQHKFARDQKIKPCGEWCNAEAAIVNSMKWSICFGTALDERVLPLIKKGKLKKDDHAIIYAAVIHELTSQCTDYGAPHIAHSVCHSLMDECAPNAGCH